MYLSFMLFYQGTFCCILSYKVLNLRIKKPVEVIVKVFDKEL